MAAQSADPGLRIVDGALALAQGPGRTLYLLSYPSRIPPTAGAWSSSCLQSFPFVEGLTLARISQDTGATLWSTCVPIRESDQLQLLVDQRTGSPIAVGPPINNFVATQGAINQPRVTVGIPGEEIGIVRVRPDGTAAEFAAVVASAQFPTSIVVNILGGAVLLPDSSLLIALRVKSPNFVVTADAINTKPPGAYLFRLSSDGTRLIFATYLNQIDEISGLALAGDGSLAMVGRISGNEAGYPAANLPLQLPVKSLYPFMNEGFLARLDLASRNFTYFSRLAIAVGFQSLRVGVRNGRATVLAQVSLREPDRPSLLRFELNDAGSGLAFFERILTGSAPVEISLDSAGNWVVLSGNSSSTLPLTTATPRRLPAYDGQPAVYRFNGTGKGLFSSTILPDNSATRLLVSDDGTVYVAKSNRFTAKNVPLLAATIPSTSAAGGPPLFYAYPKRLEICSDYAPEQSLVWDVRATTATATIEVHAESATGPVIATGPTGVVKVKAANQTYFLVNNPNGGPFGLPTTLAMESTSVETRPLRCSTRGERTATLSIQPNPVLTCKALPDSVGKARVFGVLDYVAGAVSDVAEIRVLEPLGPLFVAGPHRVAEAETGDWVRNGLEFFLASADAPGRPSTALRAYTLPVLDCVSGNPPPAPGIRATRDCAKPGVFTLAFYTGETDPVEIREGGPDGPAVARQSGFSGLVDVSPSGSQTYSLMTLRDGMWKELAYTTADPRQSCGQGKPQ